MNTIAAIATPHAVGGISVIRLSGDHAIEIADRVFTASSGRPLAKLPGYRAAYGSITEQEQLLDDGVALVFRAPKSYTGEDVVEISCHGGLVISRKVLRAVLKAGAAVAQPGEFTKRAFLNKKMSLTQAESVMDLIHAQSEQAAQSAVATMEGNLYQTIRGICTELVGIAEHLDAWVDYPEEEIEDVETEHLLGQLRSAIGRMERLLSDYDKGRILREGVETVIVGKPNVGKSTLMNLLAGCQKSIVTDIAGTTRDVVEESVDIGGVVLRLADTAGIRETEDQIEKIGVDIAKKRLKRSSLVLALFDYSQEISEQDETLIEELGTLPAVAIVNKSDLAAKIDISYIKQKFKHFVLISAKEEQGIQDLKNAVFELLHLENLEAAAPMLANERQRDCAIRAHGQLKEAIVALETGFTLDAVTVSIESAVESLLELTGERVTETVVNEVFSHFCVGK